MSSQINILNINGISPSTIIQEINGSDGIIYGNILTEILSYSIYSIIRNNTSDAMKFIKNVIHACETNTYDINIKKFLFSFINKLSKNCYDLYLQDVIGYNEIDTEINKDINNTFICDTSANHFSGDSSSSSDSENIIHIERKKI
jgi:hypothetical protein